MRETYENLHSRVQVKLTLNNAFCVTNLSTKLLTKGRSFRTPSSAVSQNRIPGVSCKVLTNTNEYLATMPHIYTLNIKSYATAQTEVKMANELPKSATKFKVPPVLFADSACDNKWQRGKCASKAAPKGSHL